jgi:hypothetical protein
MTKLTRSIGLIITAVMLVGGARGEDLPLPDAEGVATPPDLSLPAFEPDDESGLGSQDFAGQSVLSEGARERGSFLDDYQEWQLRGHEPFLSEHHGMWMNQSAPIESTGTWLRRGMWYAEADAIVWNRLWSRDDKVLAAQDPNVNIPLQPFFPTTNRLLVIEGSQPGEDASVRGTLGHFLFRDAGNRDHTVEFTVSGSGDWHQHRRLSSANDFGLFVPFFSDGGNPSFDRSTTQIVDYSSTFRSFETNYRVRQRLGRDQMIMDANGNWHRAADPGWNREYLVGLRYINLRDIFDWRAEDIQVLGSDGSYLIRTDNDMYGLQMGAGAGYERARWSVGVQSKGGVFINDASGRTALNFTADDLNDSDLRLKNDELSFVGEFKLVGRWHILPDFSLRAAYELMYITSVALGPNQATFIDDFSYLNTTQDPFYHGASFGLEGYW